MPTIWYLLVKREGSELKTAEREEQIGDGGP